MDVEIWSDIACPWCYIGKRRFERALSEFPHAGEINLTWRSFELDPAAPPERTGDRAEHLASKYGIPAERAREMEANITSLAAAEGLDYRLDIARSSNMFDGHRLIHLASEDGLGDAMKERLLSAYFTEGLLVSDHDTLVELASEVGLDPDAVRAMLASDRFADAVRADEREAGELGITGVPTFVIDRRIGVSGAQPPAALLELLQTGWDQSAQPAGGAA
jgi:predicted DsbA family dithiol-disulfide isomerase